MLGSVSLSSSLAVCASGQIVFVIAIEHLFGFRRFLFYFTFFFFPISYKYVETYS